MKEWRLLMESIAKAETKMSKYTICYTMHDRYEAVVYANSFEEASDHVYEQAGSHRFIDSDVYLDDYSVEAIDA
jgi:hypothetical protein